MQSHQRNKLNGANAQSLGSEPDATKRVPLAEVHRITPTGSRGTEDPFVSLPVAKFQVLKQFR